MAYAIIICKITASIEDATTIVFVEVLQFNIWRNPVMTTDCAFLLEASFCSANPPLLSSNKAFTFAFIKPKNYICFVA